MPPATSRRLARLALPALLVLLPACAANHPHLEGAWVCVEPAPAPGQAAAVKVLADGRFAFGRPGPVPGDPPAGGGTYEYRDGHYVETITYHWAKALVGQTITFTCEVEDGLWHHRATFTANGEPFHIDEVWRRVGEPRPGS